MSDVIVTIAKHKKIVKEERMPFPAVESFFGPYEYL